MQMIGAIIVLYNFDEAKVAGNIKRLSASVDVVCAVDNSSSDKGCVFADNEKVRYIPLMANQGIAYAQNVGIECLLGMGCRYMLFVDDDSVVEEGSIPALQRNYEQLQSKGYRVGAVGLRAYNKISGQPYDYAWNRLGEMTLEGEHYTEVSRMMSSGMFTTSDVLQDVGYMETDLFIDGVDSEWCWRGRRKGYRYFVCEDLRLNHMLGLGTRKLLGKEISITPAYRFYYQYRNYLRLVKRGYVPMKWKLLNGFKYLVKAIYYPLLGGDTKAYISNIVRGIKDA